MPVAISQTLVQRLSLAVYRHPFETEVSITFKSVQQVIDYNHS